MGLQMNDAAAFGELPKLSNWDMAYTTENTEDQMDFWSDLPATNGSLIGTLKPLPHKGCSPIVSINTAGIGGSSYQYQFPFNLLMLDKGLFLAPCGVDMKLDWCFNRKGMLKGLLKELKAYSGRIRFKIRQYYDAMNLILPLWAHCGNSDSALSATVNKLDVLCNLSARWKSANNTDLYSFNARTAEGKPPY